MKFVYIFASNLLLNMRINTRIRYGLRTMIEIATAETYGGVLQKDIAANQNISFKYLDSIISSLKLKGLINTQKGKGSGYIISRPVDEITMYDIYTAFENITVVDCLYNNQICDMSEHCMARCYWNEFKSEFSTLLKNKTLRQLIDEYYINKEMLV